MLSLFELPMFLCNWEMQPVIPSNLVLLCITFQGCFKDTLNMLINNFCELWIKHKSRVVITTSFLSHHKTGNVKYIIICDQHPNLFSQPMKLTMMSHVHTVVPDLKDITPFSSCHLKITNHSSRKSHCKSSWAFKLNLLRCAIYSTPTISSACNLFWLKITSQTSAMCEKIRPDFLKTFVYPPKTMHSPSTKKYQNPSKYEQHDD